MRNADGDRHCPIWRRSTATLATYNVSSGRNGRLEQALRATKVANVDVGVLTEAKLTRRYGVTRTKGVSLQSRRVTTRQLNSQGKVLCCRESNSRDLNNRQRASDRHPVISPGRIGRELVRHRFS